MLYSVDICREIEYAIVGSMVKWNTQLHDKVNKPTRGPTHFDEITISPKELAGWLEGGIVDFILESTCCTGEYIGEEECPHKTECIEAWLRQPAEKAEKRGDDRLSLEDVGDIVANKC